MLLPLNIETESAQADRAGAALEVRGLSVRFPLAEGVLHAVSGVDLTVATGRCLGIVGESGSGKSMAALAVMGLLPRRAIRTADTLRLGATDLLAAAEAELARAIRGKRISMIFQEPMTSLNPVYTIERQLTETMTHHRRGSAREARDRAVYLLEKVGLTGARSRLGQYPHQLSGGQRQRVMIAMALMNGPDLVIADEPTTALDVTVQAQILRLLKDLQAEFGMSLILISHDLGIISRLADTVAVMYAGHVVEGGAVDQILREPRHPYTQGLLSSLPHELGAGTSRRLGFIPGTVATVMDGHRGCPFANRCVRAVALCFEQAPPRNAGGNGSSFVCHDPVAADANAEAASGPRIQASTAAATRAHEAAGANFIQLADVRRWYTVKADLFRPKRTLRAVDGVNLAIERGEVLAIVGESGCGKSTLARLVLGLETPDAGTVMFNGKPLSDMANRSRARMIQPIFQDPFSSLNPHHTVGRIIQRPLDIQNVGTARSRHAATLDMMAKVGLPLRMYHSYPNQLSGGQRQRAAIARAIIVAPEVVICDEPTSALDVSVQSQILNLLLDLRDDLGLTLLFISHDLAVVSHMAHRIAVMYLGELVEVGSKERVISSPSHPYTRSLLASALPIAPGAGIPDLHLGAGFPNPLALPTGCRFHPRCPWATERCRNESPGFTATADGGFRCFVPQAGAS